MGLDLGNIDFKLKSNIKMGESYGFASMLLGLFFLIIIVLAIRLFGAWMLRIDEVIKQQKLMLLEIKKLTKKYTDDKN